MRNLISDCAFAWAQYHEQCYKAGWSNIKDLRLKTNIIAFIEQIKLHALQVTCSNIDTMPPINKDVNPLACVGVVQ